MNLQLGTKDRLIYFAGRERGISLSYLARARSAHNGSRSTLVRLAREASWESIRFVIAARESK